MGVLDLELGDTDDIGFVHQVRPILLGVSRVVEPAELFIVKIDSWFGEKWLGFSSKLVGQLGIRHLDVLRVPPFVPARVISQHFYRRGPVGDYAQEPAPSLHVDQSSSDNERRLMSTVCPNAAVFWWSGQTRRNRRGCLMAYLPSPKGHTGWYAELRKVDDWRLAKTQGTTAHELTAYAAGARD